ncbi:MAG: LysM peptidoglycan-binding domain-containing protein [Treponema sp.]|nr:LysM peptidoglycan-binding domain-containing protein [Treponema sp.]
MKKIKHKLPKFIDINTFDFTPYGRELTREEAYLVNGGSTVEDTHTVQSGDTLGTLVYNYNQEHGTNLTVNEVAANNGIDNPDLIYVGQQINFGNSTPASTNSAPDNNMSSPDVPSPLNEQSSTQHSNTSTNTNGHTNSVQASTTVTGSTGSSSYSATGNSSSGENATVNNMTSFPIGPECYNPNDPNPDKRYNGQDYGNEHLMVVQRSDARNFEILRDYYLTVGQYGAAGTISYDGIGLTNENGQIVDVLKDEKSILEYSITLGIPTKQGAHGDLFFTAEADLVAATGIEGAVSLVFDLDNLMDSGINFSIGFATGCNIGLGIGVGYVKRELEGPMPIGIDGNLGYLPFSFTVMTDEEGYNGGCLAYGPGKGLSTSSQKSITISPNSVIDLLNKIGE